MSSASEIIAAPRGARFCWELLHPVPLSWPPEPLGDLHIATASELSTATRLIAENGPAVWDALVRCVRVATYWQAPDEIDEALSSADFVRPLQTVAEAVLSNSTIEWWHTPLTLANQVLIDFADKAEDLLVLRIAGNPGWHAHERTEAIDVIHGPGYSANISESNLELGHKSGIWWSAPHGYGVTVTTSEVAPYGPIGLYLHEDNPLLQFGASWAVGTRRQPLSYEIDGPADWIELVLAHPLVVSPADRPDWGSGPVPVGRWVVPDWSAVASQYDAVHLTVYGYLTTAGRQLILPDGSGTRLTGWGPGETFWFNDLLTFSGAVRIWRGKQGSAWVPYPGVNS